MTTMPFKVGLQCFNCCRAGLRAVQPASLDMLKRPPRLAILHGVATCTLRVFCVSHAKLVGFRKGGTSYLHSRVALLLQPYGRQCGIGSLVQSVCARVAGGACPQPHPAATVVTVMAN